MKRVVVTLSERDMQALELYAKQCGTARGYAARRLVREGLHDFMHKTPEPLPTNQLGLFDSLQVDIFHNVSKQQN